MKTWIFISVAFLHLLGSPAGATTDLSVSRACEEGESWLIGASTNSKIPKFIEQFRDFTTGKTSPVFGFSQAVQLKRLSAILVKADFERDFSEYWVGRILFKMNLDPISLQIFHSVYDHSEIPMIRKAAFACMVRIQNRSPDWRVGVSVNDWNTLPFSGEDSETIFLALIHHFSNHSTKNKTEQNMIAGLPDGYRNFLEGLSAINDRKYSDAIESFSLFLKFVELHGKSVLDRYADDAHLYLGRSYYSMAKFKEASEQFQKVKKTSNLQIDALSDLSWSYLLEGQYDASIGISMQLRSGALRNAFAPEPMMVSAMAFNELCLYQDSIRTMHSFVNDYGPSFEWLNHHQKQDHLYSEVLKAIKKQSDVPVKVATEWIKSPIFLTRQSELNQLITHPQQLKDTRKKAIFEQGQLTAQFMQNTQKFIKEVRVAKLKLKTGEELDGSFSERFFQLRHDLRNLTRYYRASKIWKNLAHKYESKIPSYRTELVELVDQDLKKRNGQLLSLLNKIHENMDLVEVEIYNGASQDLVWKNAHPDFETMSPQLRDLKDEPASAKVWNWGRMLASDIENAEVWEDEVGALKADISDQCSKKERYLQIKVTKKGQ